MNTDYLEEIAEKYAGRPGLLLVALQEIQDHAGYIPEAAIELLAKALGVPLGDVHGVISFYRDLRTAPHGRHRLCVCRGDSCAAAGARAVAEAIEMHLELAPGDVAADGHISYDSVYCLGNCALSPSISVDGEVCGRVTPETAVRHLRELVDA